MIRKLPSRRLASLAAALVIASAGWAFAGEAHRETATTALDHLRADVARLASPELGGRLTGTEGEREAANYLAQQLADLGAQPLPGEDDLLVPFEFTAGTSDAGSTFSLTAGDTTRSFSETAQVQALSFSESAQASGEVVFAGYGLKVPESQDFGYDSYATLDVKDKIVVALRYFPEDLEGDARATLARYSGLRYKALTARENGAKALILVTGPRSANAGETIPMTFDTASAGSGIIAASLGGEAAAALFGAAGKDLEAAQQELDSGNPHVAGFPLAGVTVSLDVKVTRERREAFNVAGVLPAKRPAADGKVVLAGAHYDHLGHGGNGNSLAKKEEAGEIHYGADDNASGVAALVEAARKLRHAEIGRDVVIAFWSGEELGLLGSAAFLDGHGIAAERIASYVNLDMVGRMRDNRLTLQAVGSSEAWPRLIEQANFNIGFDINLQDDPYLPTDSASFNSAKVPSLNLFTGSHENYHRPSDRAETLNYQDLERVAHFSAGLIERLSRLEQVPVFVEVERKTQPAGDRDSVRAYTGTIPDYATEVEGLRLSGVIGGGPADEGGLREGDVIIHFGSQKITNIYDYTYALDAIRVGVPVEVVFLREGKEQRATITPRSRK